MEIDNGELDHSLHEMKRALNLIKHAIDDMYKAIDLAERTKEKEEEYERKDIQHNEN